MNDALRAVALQNAVDYAKHSGVKDAASVVKVAETFVNFLSPSDKAEPSAAAVGGTVGVKTATDKPKTATTTATKVATKPAATTAAKKPVKTEEQLVAEAAAAAAAAESAADADADGGISPDAVKAKVDELLKANKRNETIALLFSFDGAKAASGINAQGQEVMAAFIEQADEILLSA